jgi:putative nucleotidyltransferase with HDIG domain
VALLAVAISRELGLEEEKIEAINTAAQIHDIGKINLPASVLTRPGRLSKIEYDMVKTHSRLGYEMISHIEFPEPVADIILQHHERIDGSGYPQGIKGDEIIPEAKILAVADVVEAMVSHRPYRPAFGVGEAIKEIKKGKGKLYDRRVVNACIKLIKNKKIDLKPSFE